MKKLLASLFLLSGIGLGVALTQETYCVGAEEITEEEVAEEATSEEETEEVSVDEVEEIIEEDEDDELTEEKFTQKLKEYLSQYMEESMVAKLITWLIDAGVLSALFVVWVKYHKYKAKTVDEVIGALKENIEKYLKENFNNLSKEEIKKITSAISELEQSVETTMKALVLMQDTTPKGKLAVLDFLGSKTKQQEVKEIAEDLTEKIEEEETKVEEVKEAVKDDYKEIF